MQVCMCHKCDGLREGIYCSSNSASDEGKEIVNNLNHAFFLATEYGLVPPDGIEYTSAIKASESPAKRIGALATVLGNVAAALLGFALGGFEAFEVGGTAAV